MHRWSRQGTESVCQDWVHSYRTFSIKTSHDLFEAVRYYCFRTALTMSRLKFRSQYHFFLFRTQHLVQPQLFNTRGWPLLQGPCERGLSSCSPQISHMDIPWRGRKDLMNYRELSVYMLPWLLPPPHNYDVTSFSLVVWEGGTVGMGSNCGLDGVSSFQCQ